jgi:hypothetical protein
VNQAGATLTNNYYYPYGGNRGGAFSNLSTKRFTGQYHESSLPGGEGLVHPKPMNKSACALLVRDAQLDGACHGLAAHRRLRLMGRYLSSSCFPSRGERRL